jgi:hypothetical protein
VRLASKNRRIAKIDILSSSAEERERAALPMARTAPGRCGYNAWQVDAAVAKAALLRMEIRQAERRQEGLRRPAAPLGGRAHLLLVRTNRRRAKDCGNLAVTLATLVTLASIQLALGRLARAWVVNSTTRRLAINEDEGQQT